MKTTIAIPLILLASAAAHGQAVTNPVITWNRALLSIVRTPGAQSPTIHPTRSFAIMHAAIYDAVNSIDPDHEPYLFLIRDADRHASQDAAASAAAHEVLTSLYPKFQSTLDSQLTASLALIPDGREKTAGVQIGVSFADKLLSLRSNDGSAATPPAFVFESVPGRFQKTPPNFANPQFTHWANVTPFVLQQASQFRSSPPPARGSADYKDALNKTKSLGQAGSTTATADQAVIGKFWNGAAQNYWNEIAQTLALARNFSTARSARLFSLLNLAFADTVIAFYDSKYTYNLWRPVTAIRADDNDTTWLPEVGNTTPDPSYPGAHGAISAAALRVLESFFDDEVNLTVTSESLPGVVRQFTTLSAAAQEATLSRIYAGVHFSFDLNAGALLGHRVSSFVLDRHHHHDRY